VKLKILFRLTSFSLGIALLLAALFFDTSTAVSTRPQVQVTPTIDRLAQPTLPASPSQADHGAQVYWLSCLPCHGDRGQGLTDEFRQTYPEEERYCWESGCHGERPYDNGFKLPMQIPALIGPGTLQKFSNAAVLHAYVAAAMPFWKPGSLSEQDAWSVTAFVLRQNGLWDGRADLDASNAERVRVQAGPAPASPTPVPVQAGPSSSSPWPLVAAAGLLSLVALLAALRRRNRVS
jgi:cytochrome c